MARKILVIAAHSDDEALGCAGTIARHIAGGDAVHVVFMTDGVGSREEGVTNITKRQSMADQAATILGVTSTYKFKLPDNKMDSVPMLEVTQLIETVIREIQPEVIYTHHYGDLNVDHSVTHQAVITACRPQPGSCVKEIYTFEVLSSTEWQTPGLHSFIPNMYVDITSYIDIKKQVIEVYSEEMRKSPHSRSIENIIRLNALRGNTVGVEYAEAYSVVRFVR